MTVINSQNAATGSANYQANLASSPKAAPVTEQEAASAVRQDHLPAPQNDSLLPTEDWLKAHLDQPGSGPVDPSIAAGKAQIAAQDIRNNPVLAAAAYSSALPNDLHFLLKN